MKKRILSVVLVVAMMFLFVGCSSKKADTSSADDETKQESAGGSSGETLYIGMSIRGLTNPYYVSIADAAENFAAWLEEQGQPAEVVVLSCDGSDDQQVTGVKDFIAAHGENCILYVDPNNAPVALPIAEACEEAGVYWQTTWSTSDDLNIADYPHYLFHQTLADEASAYATATAMFESFDTPNEGKILAIQGMDANSASINREAGLMRALEENPGVELLESQPADWDAQKAYTIVETWLSKYDDIDGIWVANGEMALAVCELLESKGLSGEVKVTGIDGIPDEITAVEDGKITATMYSNPYLQAGLGCAYLYQAWSGNINSEDLTAEQRCFLTEGVLVTADTVEEFKNTDFNYDYSDPQVMIYQALDLPLVEGY